MSNTEQEIELETEPKPINLALRLNAEQYATLKTSAARAGYKHVSTWIKEGCLVRAGDTRQLEELLKAVAVYLEE